VLLILLVVLVLLGAFGGPRYYRSRRTTIVERPGAVVERDYGP
jgi:hypothetical protein